MPAVRSPYKEIQLRLPKIWRACLKCGKSFRAEGRFNRICARCTAKNKEFSTGSLGGLWVFPHWSDEK